MMSSVEKYSSPFVIMGVGIQGSGKSTILKPFAESVGAQYLCTDDIREEMTGDAGNQKVNNQAWGTLYERAKHSIEKGESLVVDALHTDRHYRRVGLDNYRRFGAKTVVALCVETSLEIALQRNEKRSQDGGRFVPIKVIERTYSQLSASPVSLHDGFDDIIRIENDTQRT